MAVKRMGDLPLGSVIQLPENGVPTDFIVAMHDYRSADNGIGKTLLIRDTNLGERTSGMWQIWWRPSKLAPQGASKYLRLG